jgi:DNA repair exonuclease SbcCD ATPase subunit
MTAMSDPPEQRLEDAIKAVDEAREQVQGQAKEVETAQQRASETKNLVAAAELESRNAEARYLVLNELLDKQNQLADQLDAAEKELERAKEIDTSVTKSRAALKKVIDDVKRFVASVKRSADEFGKLAEKLDADEAAAPPGQKAKLHSAARSVHGQHTKLVSEHAALQRELDTATSDYEAVPSIAGVEELKAKVDRLKQELRSAKAKERGKPAVSESDREKAKADWDNAELARRQAPEAERAAQADLHARQAALAGARTDHAEAVAAFEKVEGEFIDRIKVTEPDATGWATARAVLKPGMEIPDGYILRWQASGAPMDPDTGIGEVVRINANALPVGDTAIEATIERQS